MCVCVCVCVCESIVKYLPVQLCLTLCNPHGLYSTWNSPSKNTGVSNQPFPSSGDLLNPGIESRSTALQVDSLQLSQKCRPRVLQWVAHPYQRILLTQESSQGRLRCRLILCQLSPQGSVLQHTTINSHVR